MSIPMNLPKGAVVKGELQQSYEPDELDQDILEISLPNGLTIDVGWYPEFDPGGHFRVTVFKDYWPNQLRNPVLASDPYEVAQVVETIAREMVLEPAAPHGEKPAP